MTCLDHFLRVLVVLPLLPACAADDGGDEAAGPSTSGPGSSSSDADASSSGVDASSSGGVDSSEGSTGAPAIDYATMVQPIWNAACTCHLQGPSGTMTATVLTLNEDVSYANLVGTPAEQAPLDRVAPGDPAASYLLHKLDGTQEEVGGSGTAMPQIGMLDAEQRAIIDAWIAQGALP